MRVIYDWTSHDNIIEMPYMMDDIIYIPLVKKKQKRIVLAPKREEVVAKRKGKSMLFLSRIIEKGK
jgi:hypothetical protein